MPPPRAWSDQHPLGFEAAQGKHGIADPHRYGFAARMTAGDDAHLLAVDKADLE
jgi:hypothetical protein